MQTRKVKGAIFRLFIVTFLIVSYGGPNFLVMKCDCPSSNNVWLFLRSRLQ